MNGPEEEAFALLIERKVEMCGDAFTLRWAFIDSYVARAIGLGVGTPTETGLIPQVSWIGLGLG